MKGNLKYIITTLLMSIFVLPLIVQFVSFNVTSLVTISGYSLWLLSVGVVIMFALPVLLGFSWRYIIDPSDNVNLRYGVLSFPIIYYSIIWLIVVTFGNLNLTDYLLRIHYYFIFIYAWFEYYGLSSGVFWKGTAVALTTHVLFLAGYYFADRWANPFLVLSTARKKVFLPVIGCLALTITMTFLRPTHIADATLTFPNYEALFTTALQDNADLKIKNDWPRLDGEEATYSLYASAFYRLYRNVADENDYLQRNDDRAFTRLLAGESDLLLTTGQPARLKALAGERGIQLAFTAVALDGLVIAARTKNPRHNMTLQQLREIYAPEKPDDENLDSVCAINYATSSLLRHRLGEHIPLMEEENYPLPEDMASARKEMHGAYYRDGCMTYFFHQYLYFSGDAGRLKILSLNGVEFSPQNVLRGDYPLISTLYIVTRKEPSPETQKLVDWFLSSQGQALAQNLGYVPLYKTQK